MKCRKHTIGFTFKIKKYIMREDRFQILITECALRRQPSEQKCTPQVASLNWGPSGRLTRQGGGGREEGEGGGVKPRVSFSTFHAISVLFDSYCFFGCCGVGIMVCCVCKWFFREYVHSCGRGLFYVKKLWRFFRSIITHLASLVYNAQASKHCLSSAPSV